MIKALLPLALFFSLLLGATWPGISGAQSVKPFRITMVLFRGCEEACKGFRDYWRARKIPVEIELLDAGLDPGKLPGFVAHVKAKRPDLLVTWGTTVSLAMLGTTRTANPAAHITDIPALFMIASTPVGSGLVDSLAGSKRNISGTLYLVPVETQINAARLYLPFKRIGYLLNPTEDNARVIHAELLALAAKSRFDLITREIALDAAGKPNKASLPRLISELAADKVDFLYMAPDTFLLINRDAITKTALQHRLPVLASAEAAVIDSNALFGVVNRYYTVGQLTGSRAEQILVGKVAPKDIPIVAPPSFSLIVNMRVASELERYPSIGVLKIAEIVR